MSVHELLLLGLLADGEAHGYELHEFLATKLAFVSDLTRPTAYRLLDRMHQDGLLDRETERAGKRPERMRYRITERGLTHLDQLLRTQLASLDVIRPAGNMALLFMQRLPRKEAAELLAQRKQELEKRRYRLSVELEALPSHTPSLPIHERNLALIEADIAWLERQIARLIRESKHSDAPPSSPAKKPRSKREASAKARKAH